MKKLIFTLIIIFCSVCNLYSTPELSSKYYNYKHLRFELIIRYEYDTETLYYKGVSEVLSNYIDSLIASGKLEDKIFEIKVITANWMEHSTGVEMYKSKYSYYCWLNGLVQKIDLSYLLNIVTYFSQDTWESFCYDNKAIRPGDAVNIFNQKLPLLNSFAKDSILSQKVTVKTAEYYEIVFENDSLYVYLNEIKYCKLSNPLPTVIYDRVIIANDSIFQVFYKDSCINQIDIKKYDISGGFYEQPFSKTVNKWVNYYNNDYCFLSYSYDENKFYKLHKKRY